MTTEDTENTERENDLQCELAAWELLREARKDLEFRRELYKVQEECLEAARRERDEARRQFENLKAAAIHTCHDQCQRPMCVLRRERDEWRKKFELSVDAVEIAARLARAESERDEALAQVKELIYISERAIALAEIDFENDKFGVVSELRDGLERIKEGAK